MLARHLPAMGHPGDPGQVMWHPERLEQPLHWRKPRRIFVCSMSDLFHEAVPDSWRMDVWRRMQACPQHTFCVLTKRAVLACNWAVAHWMSDPLPNVWLGLTVCVRAELPKLDVLRQTPAALRFVSFEPLLEDVGSVDLTGISWIIVGGETGPGARPMNPRWARSLRDQCVAAGVPFFLKKLTPRGETRLDGREWKEMPT